MEKKINIIITGATNTGKTAMLTLISKLLADEGIDVDIILTDQLTETEINTSLELDIHILLDRLQETSVTIMELPANTDISESETNEDSEPKA